MLTDAQPWPRVLSDLAAVRHTAAPPDARPIATPRRSPVSTASPAHGLELKAPMPPGGEEILTPEALNFVASLVREFNPTRERLLAARVERQTGDRSRPAPGLPRIDPVGARSGLDGRAHPRRPAGPPRRDHRPRRAQDGHQRAELRGQRVHGRLRGRELADLGQRRRRPDEPARRDPPHHHVHLARGQGLQAEREDRRPAGPPARLAPRREAPHARRQARAGRAVRLRPVLLPQRARTAEARAPARTSTCPSSRTTSRRACGTTCSCARRNCSGCRRAPSAPPC